MTDLFPTIFPFLAIGIMIGIFVLFVRLDRRMSRGAHSAGAREPERPRPTGQERTPWELKAIEDQLMMTRHQAAPAVSRYDLTATVNRLVSAAGLDNPDDQLQLTANETRLAEAITRIEKRIGLPPIDQNTRQQTK